MYHEIHVCLGFINVSFITSKQRHREKSTKDFSKPYFGQWFVYGTHINVSVHQVNQLDPYTKWLHIYNSRLVWSRANLRLHRAVLLLLYGAHLPMMYQNMFMYHRLSFWLNISVNNIELRTIWNFKSDLRSNEAWIGISSNVEWIFAEFGMIDQPLCHAYTPKVSKVQTCFQVKSNCSLGFGKR